MSEPEYYKWDGTPVTNFRLEDGSFVPVLPIPKAAEYALTNYMECFPDLDVTGWADRSPDLCFKEGVAVGLMEKAAGEYNANGLRIDVAGHVIVDSLSSPEQSPAPGWTEITVEFLKAPPQWFYGELWAAIGKKAWEVKYEWVQGHDPDKLTGDGIYISAIGVKVMPLKRPEVPDA